MPDFFQASYFISETIATSGVVLNTVQIIRTFRHKQRKAPFDLSVASLSVADLCSSGFTLIFMIYWHLLANSLIKHYSIIDSVNRVCLQFGVLSSIFHLAFIAIQRVLAVTSPLKFRSRFTTTNCHRSIAVVWILSLAVSMVNFFASSVDIIGYIVLSSEVLLVIIYSIICCAVKKQDNAAKDLRSPEQNRSSVFRRIFLYAMYISLAFILCTLPTALYSTQIIKRVDPSYVYEWVRWMFYLNPTVDSLLYFYFQKAKVSGSYRQAAMDNSPRNCRAFGQKAHSKTCKTQIEQENVLLMCFKF